MTSSLPFRFSVVVKFGFSLSMYSLSHSTPATLRYTRPSDGLNSFVTLPLNIIAPSSRRQRMHWLPSRS